MVLQNVAPGRVEGAIRAPLAANLTTLFESFFGRSKKNQSKDIILQNYFQSGLRGLE